MKDQKIIEDNSLNLVALLKLFYKNKKILILSALMFGFLGVAFSFLQPNIYRSTAVLAPSDENNSLSRGIASSLGGLAGLAGISVPGGESSKASEGIKIMTSLGFFEEILKSEDLIPYLVAGKSWDKKNNKIKYNYRYNENTDEWKPAWYSFSSKSKPSSQDAFEEFKKIYSVSQDKMTGFVTVSIDHYSPYKAKELVDLIVFKINEDVRKRESEQAKKSIEYLNVQIESTNLAELKEALANLIQNQIQTVMLTEASPDFLFKTLDRSVVPEIKVKPRRSIVLMLGIIFGFIIGAAGVLFNHFRKTSEI